MEMLLTITILMLFLIIIILLVAGGRLIAAANECNLLQNKILQTLRQLRNDPSGTEKSADAPAPGKKTAEAAMNTVTALRPEAAHPEEIRRPPSPAPGEEKKAQTPSGAASCSAAAQQPENPAPEVTKSASAPALQPGAETDRKTTQEVPQSEFEKRTGEAISRFRNWFFVGEEYRNGNVAAEYAVATTWLIRIGILILVCGTGFLVKYAIDNDLLSPQMRVLAMLCAACAMVLGGLQFTEKRYHAVALGVIGLGFAAAYLGVYSANRLYDLIGWRWAYAAMILITVCAMTLSIRRSYLFPALVGTLGGYLTPILLSRGDGDIRILFAYLSIISVGVILCACFRSWKALNIFAFLLNTLLYFPASHKGLGADNYIVCLVFYCVNYALFASLPTIGLLFRRSKITLPDLLLNCAALAVFLLLALPCATRYGAEDKIAAWLMLGVGCFALIQLPLAHFTKNDDRNWNLMQLVFACAGFALFVPMMFSGIWITLAWAVLALVMIALGSGIPNRFLTNASQVLYGILAFRLFLWDILRTDFFTHLAYPSALEHRLLTAGVFLLALFSGGLLLRHARTRSSAESFCDIRSDCSRGKNAALFLGISIVLFFLYSSFELHQALRACLAGFSRGGLSVWWGLWALALLFLGILKMRPLFRKLSLLLFGICAFKIFLFDLANLTALCKVAAFLILGLLMLTGAVLYTRFRDKFSSGK